MTTGEHTNERAIIKCYQIHSNEEPWLALILLRQDKIFLPPLRIYVR